MTWRRDSAEYFIAVRQDAEFRGLVAFGRQSELHRWMDENHAAIVAAGAKYSPVHFLFTFPSGAQLRLMFIGGLSIVAGREGVIGAVARGDADL